MISLARGDVPGALQLINQAVAIVEAATQSGGNGAFYVPDLLIRRSMIELEARHADQAVDDANRAIRLQSAAQPGMPSSKSGYAYLTLGRALHSAQRLRICKVPSARIILTPAVPGKWQGLKLSVDRLSSAFSSQLSQSSDESQEQGASRKRMPKSKHKEGRRGGNACPIVQRCAQK
jgi:hypothetical protein